jgi:hypothetical protein
MVERREEVEVLTSSEPPVERPLLAADQADDLSDALRLFHHVVSADSSHARCWQQGGHEHADRRGLAGAILAREAEQLALLHLEVEAVDGCVILPPPATKEQIAVGSDPAEPLGQGYGLDRLQRANPRDGARTGLCAFVASP